MTIRYLEIFVEVCKYMNMSRAAQSLMSGAVADDFAIVRQPGG